MLEAQMRLHLRHRPASETRVDPSASRRSGVKSCTSGGPDQARVREMVLATTPACRDDAGHARGISANPLNHVRREGVQEMQAHKIQAWFGRHDSARVLRLPMRVEHRQIDPREPSVESGAPHDVRHIEHASIVERWQPVSYTFDASDAVYTSVHDLSRPGSNER